MFIATVTYAQQPALQFFRAHDKTGLNVFETGKEDSVEWDKLKVRIGGGKEQFYGGGRYNSVKG